LINILCKYNLQSLIALKKEMQGLITHISYLNMLSW
jgi:hypothetical protein